MIHITLFYQQLFKLLNAMITKPFAFSFGKDAVFLRYSRELYNETALFPKRLGRLLDKPCNIGI